VVQAVVCRNAEPKPGTIWNSQPV